MSPRVVLLLLIAAPCFGSFYGILEEEGTGVFCSIDPNTLKYTKLGQAPKVSLTVGTPPALIDSKNGTFWMLSEDGFQKEFVLAGLSLSTGDQVAKWAIPSNLTASTLVGTDDAFFVTAHEGTTKMIVILRFDTSTGQFEEVFRGNQLGQLACGAAAYNSVSNVIYQYCGLPGLGGVLAAIDLNSHNVTMKVPIPGSEHVDSMFYNPATQGIVAEGVMSRQGALFNIDTETLAWHKITFTADYESISPGATLDVSKGLYYFTAHPTEISKPDAFVVSFNITSGQGSAVQCGVEGQPNKCPSALVWSSS